MASGKKKRAILPEKVGASLYNHLTHIVIVVRYFQTFSSLAVTH